MASSSAPLKAQFLVWRPNGNQVPLIPMDEIPTNVVVHGVPRVLTAKDTAGMISIGEYDSRHAHYDVEFAGSKDGRLEYQPDRSVKSDPTKSSPTKSLPAKSPQQEGAGLPMDEGHPSPRKTFGIQEHSSSEQQTTNQIKTSSPSRRMSSSSSTEVRVGIDNPELESSAVSSSSDSRKQRAPGVKEYCSYWLRRGECDYAQQGCLYRHEMPQDLDGLACVGLRDFPPWYREQYKVTSLAAMPGSGAAGGPANISSKAKLDSNWRSPSGTGPTTYAAAVSGESPRTRSNASTATLMTNSSLTPIRVSARTPRFPRGSGSRHSAASSKNSTPGSRLRSQPKFMTVEQYAAINAVAHLQQSDTEEKNRKASLSSSQVSTPERAYIKPKFMTLDELAAMNAGAQIEKRDAEEAERKAKSEASRAARAEALKAKVLAADTRPSSRGNDSAYSEDSVALKPGLLTPATNYDSDTIIENGKAPAPMDTISSPSVIDAVFARYGNAQSKGRTQAVREARSRLDRLAPAAKKQYNVNATFKPSSHQCEADEERELIEFGFRAPEEPEGWTPDRYDHDD